MGERTFDRYYELRDWTKDGTPTLQKLVDLGLGEITKDMAGANGRVQNADSPGVAHCSVPRPCAKVYAARSPV